LAAIAVAYPGLTLLGMQTDRVDCPVVPLAACVGVSPASLEGPSAAITPNSVGYCYLYAVRPPFWSTVSAALGAYPSLGDFCARVFATNSVCCDIRGDVGVVCDSGVYHMTKTDPSSWVWTLRELFQHYGSDSTCLDLSSLIGGGAQSKVRRGRDAQVSRIDREEQERNAYFGDLIERSARVDVMDQWQVAGTVFSSYPTYVAIFAEPWMSKAKKRFGPSVTFDALMSMPDYALANRIALNDRMITEVEPGKWAITRSDAGLRNDIGQSVLLIRLLIFVARKKTFPKGTVGHLLALIDFMPAPLNAVCDLSHSVV